MSFLLGLSGAPNPNDNPEYKKSPYQRDIEERQRAAAAKAAKKQPKSDIRKTWDILHGKVD